MSITLECRKTKSEMEIGYGNFFFLRAKVAELFDKNVWQQYMKIMEIPYGDDRKQALEKWDTDMDRTPAQVIDLGGGKYRYLTELECWRLQGYSDDDFYAAESTCQVEREKMNRTLYHQAGNSIPVVIFEAMFKAMFEQGIIEVGS